MIHLNTTLPVRCKQNLIDFLAAFSGVLTGKHYLHKVKLRSIQTLTGVMILLIAVRLGTGLI